ncbi:MAG TPA: hypothetical protein VHE35_31365 [Kofleriaceae bacterium]|nr:hypothetical protein [Kofleriaceae bacterium]
MTDALEFSRRGDEVFGRLAACFPDAVKKRLLVEQRLPTDRFEAIRASMLGYLARCVGSDAPLTEAQLCERLLVQRHHLANYRTDGMMMPKREHVAEWNLLHKAVAASFRDFGIEAQVDVIDVPFNVRVVYGEPLPGRSSIAYASSKVHSDVWAGVPPDAVVVVLPVLGAIEHITIEAGEMAREQELAAMRVFSDYDQGNREHPYVEKYADVAMKRGHVYLADCRGLHNTVRYKREGVRVSIDFRFRLNDPGYRAMVPEVRGPESMDTRLAYRDWLDLGCERAIVFDDRVADARDAADTGPGVPFGVPHRLVDLFPAR